MQMYIFVCECMNTAHTRILTKILCIQNQSHKTEKFQFNFLFSSFEMISGDYL